MYSPIADDPLKTTSKGTMDSGVSQGQVLWGGVGEWGSIRGRGSTPDIGLVLTNGRRRREAKRRKKKVRNVEVD